MSFVRRTFFAVKKKMNMAEDNSLVEVKNKVVEVAKTPEVQLIGGFTVAGGVVGSFIPVIGTGIGADVVAICGGATCIEREVKKRRAK